MKLYTRRWRSRRKFKEFIPITLKTYHFDFDH